MAYQAKRRKQYEEEFQLVEENGTVARTLKVSLDADSMVRKLSEKHTALVRALQDVQNVKDPEKGLEVLGNAVTDMFEAVFGAENTKTILEFYDNRYVEMCQEVVPFIATIVIPEVRNIAKVNKKEILSQYNRKQRRFLQRR